VTFKARMLAVVAVLVLLSAGAFAMGWHRIGTAFGASAAAVVAAYYFLIFRPARIPADSLLRLRLSGRLSEHSVGSLIDRLMGREFVTMHYLRDALGHAAADPALAAVMVQVGGVSCGMACAQELHDLLAAVGRSGKRTIAVLEAEATEPLDYLIAAGAHEIIANPDTALMMLGLSAGGLFLKRALARVHIGAQSLQWKEYKGAGEITSREHMSPQVRESLEALVRDWQRVLVDYVARARGFDAARAGELLNGGFLSARAAQQAGLIDRLGHAQDVLAEFEPQERAEELMPLLRRLMRAGRWREREKPRHTNRVIELYRYLRRTAYLEDKGHRPRIGLVYGLGPVIAGESPRGGEFISGQQTAAELMQAARDPRVRAVLFRVNSPGGSALGSDLVWRAVTEVRRRGKPVVVSMGDVAGSGGYYVSMAADAIVAQPSTLTGSIGVVYTKFNLADLLDRVGINVDYAKTSPSADALSLSRAMTEQELEQLNQVMGELYGNFCAKVSEGRKLDPAQTEAVARGRVWSGAAAAANGLVDELGGMARAVEVAREKARLAPGQEHELALYSGLRGVLNLRPALTPSAQPVWWVAALARLTGWPEQWLPALAKVVLGGGISLLSPWP
jgi:protease-4